MIATYTCPNCGEEIECEYSPGRPAPFCQNHDSPAFSDPGDPEELDIVEECPNCHEAIDEDKAREEIAEKYADSCQDPDYYEDE